MKFKGFSLIELLVVVSLIGILSAIAMPIYRSYQIRAAVSEAVTLLDHYKLKVSEHFARTGALPVNPLGAGPVFTLNTRHVVDVRYYRTVTEPNSIWIMATLNTTTTGLPSGSNLLIMIVGHNKSSNILEAHCGQWAPTGYVPVQYLPAGCNETNVQNWQTFYTNQ